MWSSFFSRVDDGADCVKLCFLKTKKYRVCQTPVWRLFGHGHNAEKPTWLLSAQLEITLPSPSYNWRWHFKHREAHCVYCKAKNTIKIMKRGELYSPPFRQVKLVGQLAHWKAKAVSSAKCTNTVLSCLKYTYMLYCWHICLKRCHLPKWLLIKMGRRFFVRVVNCQMVTCFSFLNCRCLEDKLRFSSTCFVLFLFISL